MPTFPTLTESGLNIAASFPINEQREDSVIRSEFEGGYVQTRAIHTRVRKKWNVNYHNLSSANKASIDTFIDTVNGGADSFTWTNPQDSANYTVRFREIPNCSYISYNRWEVNFTLEQV